MNNGGYIVVFGGIAVTLVLVDIILTVVFIKYSDPPFLIYIIVFSIAAIIAILSGLASFILFKRNKNIVHPIAIGNNTIKSNN